MAVGVGVGLHLGGLPGGHGAAAPASSDSWLAVNAPMRAQSRQATTPNEKMRCMINLLCVRPPRTRAYRDGWLRGVSIAVDQGPTGFRPASGKAARKDVDSVYFSLTRYRTVRDDYG